MLSSVADHPLVTLLSRFASLIVIPVFGFLGTYVFNSIEEMKDKQAETNVHIAVIETTLPTLSDRIKYSSDRVDKLENHQKDKPTITQRDLDKRDARIHYLQNEIKRLLALGKQANSVDIQKIQTELAFVMVNDELPGTQVNN